MEPGDEYPHIAFNCDADALVGGVTVGGATTIANDNATCADTP